MATGLTNRSAKDLYQISTANANRDGTGTLVTLKTGATYGSLVNYITFVAPNNTTAGMLRLFLFDGTNTRLVDEITVEAITVSATVAGFKKTWVPSGGPFEVPPTWILKGSTHNGEVFNAEVISRDL